MLDHDGISDLVIEAMSNGATSANIPGDPDNFTLTFSKAATAAAFLKAVEKHKSDASADDVAKQVADTPDVSPTEE